MSTEQITKHGIWQTIKALIHSVLSIPAVHAELQVIKARCPVAFRAPRQ